MESHPRHDPRSIAEAPQASVPLAGVLPTDRSYCSSGSSGGVVTKDGRLQVGAFTLSLDAMMRHLGTSAQLCKRIPEIFPNEEVLSKVLPGGGIPIPLGSLEFSEAYQAVKRVMVGEVRDIDFVRCKRTIESVSEERGLSLEELIQIRSLLIEGARIATACTGIDEALDRALSYRSIVQRGRDWVVDRAGSTNLLDPRIRSKLQVMPFEEFNPRSLRIGLDLMAQRIQLRGDGSPAVREVCKVECAAAELLQQGLLSRKATLSDGGIEGHFLVASAHGAIFSELHRVEDVFSALRLGQSASRMIAALSDKNVDLVRLCRFVNRSSAIGVQTCLESLTPQAHLRLSDLDEWAPRFESGFQGILSHEERHDLGALLLDAEVCLLIADHLRAVCTGVDNAAFWRSLWTAGASDRDVRAGRELVNHAPTVFSCDCAGAQSVVSSAAMLLGFTGEDRSGAGWRVPENSVVSLAWAMTQQS